METAASARWGVSSAVGSQPTNLRTTYDSLPSSSSRSWGKVVTVMLVVVVLLGAAIVIVIWQTVGFGSSGGSCDTSDPSSCPDGQWCNAGTCARCNCDDATQSCSFESGCVAIDPCANSNPKTCRSTADGDASSAPCNETSGEYECPPGTCDVSTYSSACSQSAQICQSSTGTFACSCSGNTTPPVCAGSARAGCIDGNWACTCAGEVQPQQSSACTEANGDWECKNSSAGWSCFCGGVTPFDPTGTSASQGCPQSYDDGSGGGTVSATCNPVTGSITCMCNSSSLDEDARASCLSADSNNLYVCTANGFSCVNTTSVCGSDKPTDMGCDVSELVCNPATGEYYCPGVCSTTTCVQDRNVMKSAATRATWSLYCSTADDVASCMKDHGINTDAWGGLPFESACYEKAGTPSGTASVCARTSYPMPVGLPVTDRGGNGARLAGSITPTSYLIDNSKYNYAGVKTIASNLVSYPQNAPTDVQMNKPFVLVPVRNVDAPKCPLPTSADGFQWYVLPIYYSGVQTGIFMQPAQAFHPFLAWAARPSRGSNEGGTGSTYQPTKAANNESIKTLPDSTLPNFFLLQHDSSFLFFNNKGCHATSSDGGRSCSTPRLVVVTPEQETCFQSVADSDDPTSLDPCVYLRIQGSGNNHNNAFTFWAWSQGNTSCKVDPGSTPYAESGDSADVTKSSPQHDSPCVGTLVSPFTNDKKRQNLLYLQSPFAATGRAQMYHRDKYTQIMGLTIASAADPGGPGTDSYFWQNYNPRAHWPVHYVAPSTPPYNQSRSKTFVAPLQYGLCDGVTLGGLQLEAYSWIDDTYDDWRGLGVLSYGADGAYSESNPVISDGRTVSNGRTSVTVYGSYPDAPSCSDGQTSDNCCKHGSREWTVWIQNVSSATGRAGPYLIASSTPIDGSASNSNLYRATFTGSSANALNVTRYGHLYLAANNSSTGHDLFLCMSRADNSLFFVDLEAELASSSPTTISYLCPMWSLLKPF